MLNVFDVLGDDDVASFRQSAVLDRKRQKLMAVLMPLKNMKSFPADNASLRTSQLEIIPLLVTEEPSFLDPSCTRASIEKLFQSILKSLSAVLKARQ